MITEDDLNFFEFWKQKNKNTSKFLFIKKKKKTGNVTKHSLICWLVFIFLL